jgi:hypothetical protein
MMGALVVAVPDDGGDRAPRTPPCHWYFVPQVRERGERQLSTSLRDLVA